MMIFYLIDLIIVAIFLAICIGLSFLKVYLLQINIINSVVLGSFTGVFMYCFNRYTDVFGWKMPFEFVIHPAFCIVGGFAVFFLTMLVQRTKVGFWIFAIFFSVVWGLVPAFLVYLFTKDFIWFWVILGAGILASLNAHMRSRKLKVDLTNSFVHPEDE